MKLTCVLIIAVLCLTVCQLITADYLRDKQKYRSVRLRDGMLNFKGSRQCADLGEECYTRFCCPGLRCKDLQVPTCLLA
uniref:Conotoxin ArMKLT2-0313 n=1 Tax=Conus arenatus TaxID=89451 RepID=O1610_CONAE|nr:RecName: Full=Conotoxin ArMKLT2-0313; Flags: Precursor [Conus arenatus]AAG60480.1 conotoxin scaffold VI/VII precursor [Conus arenatus]